MQAGTYKPTNRTMCVEDGRGGNLHETRSSHVSVILPGYINLSKTLMVAWLERKKNFRKFKQDKFKKKLDLIKDFEKKRLVRGS